MPATPRSCATPTSCRSTSTTAPASLLPLRSGGRRRRREGVGGGAAALERGARRPPDHRGDLRAELQGPRRAGEGGLPSLGGLRGNPARILRDPGRPAPPPHSPHKTP